MEPAQDVFMASGESTGATEPEEQRSQSAGPGESTSSSQPQFFRSLSFDAGSGGHREPGSDAVATAAAAAPAFFVPLDPSEVAFLNSAPEGRDAELKAKKQRVRFRNAVVDPLTSAFLRASSS